MRKLTTFLVTLLMLAGLAQAQEVIKGTASISESDTTVTQRFYWKDGVLLTGAVTLAGAVKVTAGGDSTVTPKIRLIMKNYDPVMLGVAYDSSAAHTLTAKTGDYWDSTPSTGAAYNFDLAEQDWWKPNVGIEVTFEGASDGTWTKQISCYVIRTKESE
jgi:hypothetical protein